MARALTAPIALTMGEPAGVGPEITIKAHETLKGGESVFFVIADPALFKGARLAEISAPDEAASVFADALPILPIAGAADAIAGAPSPKTAPAVIASIERAVAFALAGEASAVITNPIQKSALFESGFKFPGHTEFLEALTAAAPMPAARRRGAVMMIAGPDLRTVPVTIHQSVREAAASLSAETIVNKAMIVIEALRAEFAIAAPRLAISGLNPHAGEGGAMGTEDRDIIAPAIAQLHAMTDAAITGPHPADTLFHARARKNYDAALCMLHDQALIPAKTLAFDEAVNATLGLPIIRTSPDHGTALDIAGKGLANPSSLIAALRLAGEMAKARHAR